jgi:hypothetical protein
LGWLFKLQADGFLRPRHAMGGLSWLEPDADQHEGEERSQDDQIGIEEIMTERGLQLISETVRKWWLKFGQRYANALC